MGEIVKISGLMFRYESKGLEKADSCVHKMQFFLKNEHKSIKLLLRLALMPWIMRMWTATMDYAAVTDDSQTPKP